MMHLEKMTHGSSVKKRNTTTPLQNWFSPPVPTSSLMTRYLLMNAAGPFCAKSPTHFRYHAASIKTKPEGEHKHVCDSMQ